MVAALQRLTASFFGEWRGSRQERTIVTRKSEDETCMVGDYHADYSELTPDELAASDSDADALIARSRVVSSKRL